jgi:hypothetical protein
VKIRLPEALLVQILSRHPFAAIVKTTFASQISSKSVWSHFLETAISLVATSLAEAQGASEFGGLLFQVNVRSCREAGDFTVETAEVRFSLRFPQIIVSSEGVRW